MERNYLIIGRDVLHKHYSRWTAEDWTEAQEYLALALWEQDQRGEGDDDGEDFEDALAEMVGG